MKKIASTMLLTCIYISSYAQLNIGLKLNWNLNKFDVKATNVNEKFYSKAFDYNSLTLGGTIMANYKLSKRFSLQSEIIYDPVHTNLGKQEYYINDEGERNSVVNYLQINMNYLDIPLLAKLSFGNKATFDIIAGGYAGYLLSAKQSVSNGILYMPKDTIYDALYGPQPKEIDYPTHNVRRDYTAFNMGILLGLGVTLDNKVIFELRLNRGLVNINKKGSAQMYTIQGQFTVGYYLFRQKNKA